MTAHRCPGSDCRICQRDIDEREWHRNAPSLDDKPLPTRVPRGVSLRKRFSGPREYQQWRRARWLITGEWPA